MVNNTKISMAALAVVVGSGPSMVFAEDKPEGFVEGSSLTVLNRNFYFNRDHRNGQSSPTGNGYSEAWAQGIISRFESGFTQGTVGFGVDAFAAYGLRLDSTRRRSGNGGIDFFIKDSNGNPEHDVAKGGASLKADEFLSIIASCPLAAAVI